MSNFIILVVNLRHPKAANIQHTKVYDIPYSLPPILINIIQGKGYLANLNLLILITHIQYL